MSKTKFNDLSKAQQKELLKIADAKIARTDAVKAHNKTAHKLMEADFKKFLSKDGEYSEAQVSTDKLKYKKKKVARIQNISGQFIERCMITMENNYQLSITRPAQVYGSDPNLFDVSPRKPDGESDTTMLDSSQTNTDTIPGQTLTDINKHINKIAKIDPDEERKKAEAAKEKATETNNT